jgi:hypothetical protein
LLYQSAFLKGKPVTKTKSKRSHVRANQRIIAPTFAPLPIIDTPAGREFRGKLLKALNMADDTAPDFEGDPWTAQNIVDAIYGLEDARAHAWETLRKQCGSVKETADSLGGLLTTVLTFVEQKITKPATTPTPATPSPVATQPPAEADGAASAPTAGAPATASQPRGKVKPLMLVDFYHKARQLRAEFRAARTFCIPGAKDPDDLQLSVDGKMMVAHANEFLGNFEKTFDDQMIWLEWLMEQTGQPVPAWKEEDQPLV